MTKPATIIANRVRYFHYSDELTFFGWLDRMDIIAGYEGRADCLHIQLSRQPSDEDLRELLAFHERYRIDMRQLAQFETPDNVGWFANPAMYWHESVFGVRSSSQVEGNAKFRQ
ncbi:MAG TPA: hypothetical protein VFL92_11525 [Sphingomonas sp.]|nr:hypothetical protein [Sphingomonas sp.]